jgi:thiamine-phosphate pyrophosphorylase
MMTDPARLYLVVPPHTGGQPGFPALLEAALGAGDVASVLFDAPPGPAEDQLALYIQMAQSHGAAALVTNDPKLARQLEADGVHVRGLDALPSVLRALKPAGIVGAGALASRDDAMVAGEQGADYVMFGDEPVSDSFEARLDRIAWWAEIFQVPCVAMAANIAEVRPFAEAGAEFVALADAVWADPRGPGAAVADALTELAEGHAAFLARTAEHAA